MRQDGSCLRSAKVRAGLQRAATALVVALSCWMTPTPSAAAEQTYLLDLYTGSARSDIVRGLRVGGYELADGASVSFDDWYTPALPDLTVLFLTEITDNFGMTWGMSSGESGEKYSINPAVHLGVTWQMQLFRNATLSASVQTVLGGRLRESSCNADYGTFGRSEVNCRLAASLIPPEETLDYLINVNGRDESRASLRFEFRF